VSQIAKAARQMWRAGTVRNQVALARALLDAPHWGWHATQTPGADVKRPNQYLRVAPAMWTGAVMPAAKADT
jgi:hypothetical protein